MDFNDRHPEMRDGEKFIGNYPPAEANLLPKMYRTGRNAYWSDGSAYPDRVPVFASKARHDAETSRWSDL